MPNSKGFLARLRTHIAVRARRHPLLLILVLGAGGMLALTSFHSGMQATNKLEFCVSCHEMADNNFQEYKKTVHYQNRTGVRATCPDCHVPKEWFPKVIRKIQASNELLHKFILHSVDTPEKFQAKRHKLAENEWARMRANSVFIWSLLAMVCEVKTFSSWVASQCASASSGRRASMSMPEAVTCAGTRAPST